MKTLLVSALLLSGFAFAEGPATTPATTEAPAAAVKGDAKAVEGAAKKSWKDAKKECIAKDAKLKGKALSECIKEARKAG